MSIKKQFRRAFLALAAAILVCGGLLGGRYVQSVNFADARNWAHEVVRAAFDCNVFGTEYVTDRSERAKEQYRVRSAELGEFLAQPPRILRGEKYAQQIAVQKLIIDELVWRFEESASKEPSVQAEQLSMLSPQIVLQCTGMLSAAQALYTTADEKAADLRYWTLIYVFSALGAVGLITGIVFYRAEKRLVRPLHKLAEGAKRLGAGELDYRMEIGEGDELGMLAHNFNLMAEQLARRQMDLKEKLQDLDTFCYSLAHDLKAPLRTVAGFGDLLEEERNLSKDGLTYVAAMRQATLKMATLIEDLLGYGALTHKEFAVTVVALKPIITESIKDLEREIQSQQGQVELQGTFPNVWGNKVVLKQVFLNLVANALRFVPPGTKPEVVIAATVEGQRCKITVRDNGIGIPKEHQKRIFGLFQRLHSDAEYPGTGVGLAMVEKGVHLLGGLVGVDSEVGKGSVFWITLRHAAEEQSSTRIMAGDTELRARARELVGGS